MDTQQYKDQKLDKLTRDVVKMVNQTPSFGYGEVVDTIAKNTLTNYLLTVISISEISNVDLEIFGQSLCDELVELNVALLSKIAAYKNNIQENS